MKTAINIFGDTNIVIDWGFSPKCDYTNDRGDHYIEGKEPDKFVHEGHIDKIIVYQNDVKVILFESDITEIKSAITQIKNNITEDYIDY